MAGTLEMKENDIDVAYKCIKRNLKECSYKLLVFLNKVLILAMATSECSLYAIAF